MPVFHTKTIESILEPVAQQVSRLVILHEEAEDGNAMPDLSRPVQAVSKAVTNLIKVGRETINSSDDVILRQDMPAALQRVEKASKLLEEASGMLKLDPYSQPARKKLIEGARGILQGTSALLLCFDESEVRKIIRECKRVLDYLAVAEVVESMEDLVQFVKDLSPCLTKVSRDVDAREKELTHQVHREILVRCLESVKALAPILICSMKIFVQIIGHGGKEAAENRNYLAQRMTDEIHEIIRVLQLVTYDEDEWDADNLTVMKKSQNAIRSKRQAAHDWLEDPTAVVGGLGEKSIRQILDYACRVSERALPRDRDAIRKLCGDISAMTNALCELRQDGKGATSQESSLARGIDTKLLELLKLIDEAIINIERSGIQQLAHTLGGRLEQAQHWLSNPAMDDKGLGQQAIQQILEESRRLADGCSPQERSEIQTLSSEVESHARQLVDLCRRGQGNSPQAFETARKISNKLQVLRSKIQKALINRVVEDFIDISSPLKQFTDAVYAPEGVPNRESIFQEKAQNLMKFAQRVSATARNVAKGGTANKKLAEALIASANQVESLTPQLRNAGRIRMDYPENKAADEHFENLMKQYNESLQKMRFLADEAIDTASFIRASEENIVQHTNACENAITLKNPQKMVDNTSTIARMANRVLMVAKQESDNSEDPHFILRVNQSADTLQSTVTPMVQDAKSVAMNISDQVAISRWRDSNKALITSVGLVRHAVTVTPEEPPEIPPPPDMSRLKIIEKPKVHEIPDFSEIFNVDFNSIFAPVERPPPREIPLPVSEEPEVFEMNANGHCLSPTEEEKIQYHFFSNKVGPTVRQQPSPTSSPVPSPQPPTHISPTHYPPSVSPLPKWAQGDNADLLCEEVCVSCPVSQELDHPYVGLPTSNVNNEHTDVAPPRPPLPGVGGPPPRPPPPETDDEFEASFPHPLPNQPIMMAAHGLHQEVRQWSSKDNDIIAAAKQMALLMARLSQLVRGEGGSKKDLIACAKAIAEASEEVTRLAKELARMCTDKRMRTNILQVCERIPTIGTQLRILSTVKATMLGAQAPIPTPDGSEIICGTEEDQEATDMLVGNAQNLMQSVKETVRACEAASIKIRTDSGIHLRWVRKQPWYQY